jgi:DNA adenine methylase
MKATLIDRVRRIGTYASRIEVLGLDGIHLMRKLQLTPSTLVYVDPPYYQNGRSLYMNHYGPSQHETLAAFLNAHPLFHWLLTYDNVREVRRLYTKRHQHEFDLCYHTNKPRRASEVLITADCIQLPPGIHDYRGAAPAPDLVGTLRHVPSKVRSHPSR